LISIRAKYSLLKRTVKDYAYYIESKEFDIRWVAITKLGTFFLAGAALSVLSVPAEEMVLAFIVFASGGMILEATNLVGRPHPTPNYVPSRMACGSCKKNGHEFCTNTRTLDSFETAFRSSDGELRPICCCGFQIHVSDEIPNTGSRTIN
jgi:hypothetical protein